jgi:hypothetical protein
LVSLAAEVFSFETSPLSCGPTGHWLSNPVGFRILRFNAHAIIIKTCCEVVDFIYHI